MVKRLKILFISIIGIVILIELRDNVYAQSAILKAKKDGVKVVAETSTSAPILKVLKKDEYIQAKGRKGMFWIVKLNDTKEGYVYSLDVSRVSTEDSNLAQTISSMLQKSRDMDEVKETRTRSGVMGVRGLQASSTTNYAGNVKPNIRMVYMMEDRKITKQDIDEIANEVSTEIENKIKTLK